MFLGRVCVFDRKSSGGEQIVRCRLLGCRGTDRACGQIYSKYDCDGLATHAQNSPIAGQTGAQSVFSWMPSLARSSFNTRAIASMIRICGFALQVMMVSCSSCLARPKWMKCFLASPLYQPLYHVVSMSA